MKQIAGLIDLAFRVFTLGLFVRIVFSWIRPSSLHGLVVLLDKVYEPVLQPMRRLIKPLRVNGNPPVSLDLYPLVLLLCLWLVAHPFLMWAIRF